MATPVPLSRDVLKWIQSLDLSYAVRNVKRDFCNGFLIAEIFSRYYKSDIDMHSFDNASKIEKREANWKLLKKFLKKKNFDIKHETIDMCINCNNEAAVALINQVYELLTNKRVATRKPTEVDDYQPPFSRPTANTLIANRMMDTDIVNRPDETHMRTEAQKVVDDHNEALRQERTNEPQRFMPQRYNPNNTIGRIATRKVGPNEASNPPVQFKKVDIKQIDEGVAQLRAMHSSTRGGQGFNNSLTGSQMGGNSSSLGGGSNGAGRNVVKPSIELLNTCVLSKLDGMDVLKRFDPRKDAMVCFVEDLTSVPDEISASVFEDAQKKVSHLIAENCLASPKEYWNFFSICWTAVAGLRASSKACKSVVSLLENVGQLMVEKDQYVPFALFTDFGLPKVLDMLKAEPRRPHITRVLYAFCVADVEEHVNVIRKLRDGFDDFDTLVLCLSSLITQETRFSTKILDLYLYYIVAGLRNTSGMIRGCCIEMLVPIAKAVDVHGHKHVINLLDRLYNLASNDGWQVKAAVLRTVCALLSVLPPKELVCASLYTMVDEFLGPSASPLVLQTGVVALSGCIGLHQNMIETFMNLVHSRPDVVSRAMGCSSGFCVETVSGPIGPLMDRKAVAVAIAEHVKTTKPDNLTPAEIRLMGRAVEGLSEFAGEDVTEWVDVYQTLRDHLVVELYEPTTCADAGLVLMAFLSDNQTRQVALELLSSNSDGVVPPLYGILKLIYPDGDEVCKKTVADFLDTLAGQTQSDFPKLVYKLLMNFRENEPEQFSGSALEVVLGKLSE